MKNNLIIVLVGESGSGKSFIMREILSKYPNINIIPKYTTRKKRIDEEQAKDVKPDTDFSVISSFRYSYTNPYNHEKYGFCETQIQNSLANGKILLLDLSNEGCYFQLISDYPNQVLILNIIPYLDEEKMYETFKVQKRDEHEYVERKVVFKNPITTWVYKYRNRREIINPYFLRNITPFVEKVC